MISVIIPVYNAQRYLAETLDSVLNQTYKDFELILVNDGSTDNSLEILREYEKKDSRVKVITDENHGAPHARNLGFDNSKGEYIMFFDADDIMEPRALEILSAHMSENDCDLVIGAHSIISEDGRRSTNARIYAPAGVYDMSSPSDLTAAMRINAVPGNKLFSAAVMKKYNVCFSELKMAQDLNFYLKYIAVCSRVRVTEDILYRYRIVNGSISHTSTLKVMDVIKSLDGAYDFAKSAGADKIYFDELANVRITNYYLQFSKAAFARDKKIRRTIFDTLSNLINEIATENGGKLSAPARKCVEDIRQKNKYKFIYLSRMYTVYRELKVKIHHF